MGVFEQFPYTNFHDLNLDWILHAIQSMDKKLDEFVASNVLSYADPIQWDIETQYTKNTVVVDPKTGTAYMSINPVPVGQLLTNKYYWQPIFNYDEIVNTLKKQIAAVQADQHDTISVSVKRGDLVWIVNTLYRVTQDLAPGSKIIPDSNAEKITVEEAILNINTTKNITRNTDGTITDTAGTITRNSDNIIDTANDAISVSGKTITNAAADSITNSSTNITDTASAGITRNAVTITDTATGDVSVSGKNITNNATSNIETRTKDKTESVTGTETATKNIVNETVNNLTLVGNNELKFKSDSLVLDSNGEPIKLGMNVTDDLYYGTLKVREATGNVREIMVKNNGTPNLARKHGFNTKNVVIIGDSFAGTWYSGYTSYAYILKDLLNIETLHVYSIGGAGYVGKGNLAPYENVTYQEYLDDAFNTEMSTYANDVTLVIVQGGGNDYKQEYSRERTAVKNLITDIKNKFTNADIYGVSGFWLHNMYSDTKNGIINGYNEAGVPLFNHSFYTFINHAEYFASDKLHPNELGMKIMANAIANDILYGIPYDCNQGGFIPASGGGFVWQITGDGLLRGYVITTETETVCAIPKPLQPAENDVFGFAYTGTGAFVALWYNNGALRIYAPQGTTVTETKGSISWFLNANDNNATG